MSEIKDWGNEPPTAGKKDIKHSDKEEEIEVPKDWQPSEKTIQAIATGKISDEEKAESSLSQKGISAIQGKEEKEN
jgi:hypothetical protein